MKFIPMSQLLKAAAADGYAVPSFCVWSSETMLTVLQVAEDLKAPVILMAGPLELELLPAAAMGAVAHALAQRISLKAALHLDHGNSLKQVEDCLAAGFTSVMLDFSCRPYAENVAALRQVAVMARPRGATVEGEIGHVGKVDSVTQEGSGVSTLTDPNDATRYATETGVDALAISIGNAHGHYTRLPQFDFERLAQIRSAVSVPLVLHGGSGTPDADLKRAISLGMAKVNVATDSITAVRESLRSQWNAEKNLWLPTATTVAMKALAAVVEKWIRRMGAAGRA